MTRTKVVFVNKKKNAPKPRSTFVGPKEHAGLLVTAELQRAIDDCKLQVAKIVKTCRAQNRKFRDVEFDLELDRERCLHGLAAADRDQYSPADVQRVTQIFENPQFFVDGVDANDIVQGALGDCWFLSALATMSATKGLVEKCCVARDEQVGVYGFIFFRDIKWVTVVIDDMLFTSIPKFEELSYAEKALYHNDKDHFNVSARKGGKTLLFSRTGANGETWVPLIEKAYAKLHGDYASLSGGEAGEAIEDMTGGVSTFISPKDILDIDRFWNEELLKANRDRLFGCSFGALDTSRTEDPGANVKVNGLFGAHAYSVLRAVEHKGKRFVVVRNPWGESEWTGRWADGSKEWTKEWLGALDVLGHQFGEDGQFLMEYHDFLQVWDQIDRTLIFGSSWVLSSQWLQVPARPFPAAWAYGDVSFTLSIPVKCSAVIVLSQLDDRFFHGIGSPFYWMYDLVLFRKGTTDAVGESSKQCLQVTRSVSLEIDELPKGEYVVHVRLDRCPTGDSADAEERATWDERKLSRVLTEKVRSESIASNFKQQDEISSIPIELQALAGQDLATLDEKMRDILAHRAVEEKPVSLTPTESTEESDEESVPESDTESMTSDAGTEDTEVTADIQPAVGGSSSDQTSAPNTSVKLSPTDDEKDSITLGLCVYTNVAAASPVVIGGQLRQTKDLVSFAELGL